MNTFIMILIVLAAIMMIGTVLVQKSKGGGLASSFSSSNQIMGVRKTTDFVEKLTWGLAITMIVLSIGTARFTGTQGARSQIDFQQPAFDPTTVPDIAPTTIPFPQQPETE